ncbi:LysR substrate-binding domain-containing protein [Profundibacter sp.]
MFSIHIQQIQKVPPPPPLPFPCRIIYANKGKADVFTSIQYDPYKNRRPLQFTIESTRFTNSTLSAHALILNNGGIAALPDYVVKDDLKTGRLVRLLPDYQLAKTPVYACHPYGNQTPARVRLCLVALTGLV